MLSRKSDLGAFIVDIIQLESELTDDTQAYFKNIEPHHPERGGGERDKGASCSTDDTIPYSLRSPIAMLKSGPSLISWRSPLREDAVGIATCQAGSSWMWSPTRPTNAELVTAMGATDIRGSSTPTADSAGLNEGREGGRRLETAWCTGHCAGPNLYGRV